MKRLVWIINRLRCMSVAEVLYRLQVRARTTVESLGLGLAKTVPPASDRETLCWIAPQTDGMNAEPYLARAERVLAGRFEVFALEDAELGFPPEWNRDPRTGTRAPLRFGKTLDYRNEAIAGDIKYLWEINRHRELLWLAQAWRLSGDRRFLDGIATLLTSWFAQCPYPKGVNWTSSLEHAVRLIHWSAAWALVGGDESPLFERSDGLALRRAWIDSIYQHLHFIAGHFSRHSSANNHLIGEYAGLYIGSTVWPLWKACGRWRDVAKKGLEEEIHRQNHGDGFNREQATWYHHEVAELFLICALTGRAAGEEFRPDYWSALEGMIDALALLTDRAGNVPAIGDADDAVYLELGLEREVYGNLLAAGAVLFARRDFRFLAGSLPGRARWLLGEEGARAFDELVPEKPAAEAPLALPESGYWILGSRFHEPGEVRLLLDAGPLGFTSIAAHGHADALSLLLSVDGRPVLIDPGTFAYHTKEKWRSYFRGTTAHNTLAVDDEDQSVQAGNFMWLKHAEARCLRCEREGAAQVWEAEHFGYRRLADPVTHRRRVRFFEREARIEIVDEVLCGATHAVALHWHIPDNCEVGLNADEAVVETGPIRVKLAMPDSMLSASLHRGEEDPPLGWESVLFDRKTPAKTLRFAGTVTGETRLHTTIAIEGTDKRA